MNHKGTTIEERNPQDTRSPHDIKCKRVCKPSHVHFVWNSFNYANSQTTLSKWQWWSNCWDKINELHWQQTRVEYFLKLIYFNKSANFLGFTIWPNWNFGACNPSILTFVIISGNVRRRDFNGITFATTFLMQFAESSCCFTFTLQIPLSQLSKTFSEVKDKLLMPHIGSCPDAFSTHCLT